MAKVYFDTLVELASCLDIAREMQREIVVKHFFNGAALYVEGRQCVSWSPAGLAFKLPEPQAVRLIRRGDASELRYFDRGHVKKGYAVFDAPENSRPSR